MLEVEPLDAAEDGREHPVHVGRRENEDDVRGRFLERLEQGVPGAGRKHVRFVDDENLVLADDGRVLDAVDNNFADVLDARVGGGVDFKNVHRVAAGDILAAFALATGVQRVAAGAVECAGEDTGTGGLAYTAGAGKKECMMKATPFDSVLEGLCDMFLPDHVVK